MRILFDQGTPLPLRRLLVDHSVSTAFERGWSTLSNGELLDVADSHFDLLITTDRHLRHQQNLAGRHLAILVLGAASWPRIERHAAEIVSTIRSMVPGDYRELTW